MKRRKHVGMGRLQTSNESASRMRPRELNVALPSIVASLAGHQGTIVGRTPRGRSRVRNSSRADPFPSAAELPLSRLEFCEAEFRGFTSSPRQGCPPLHLGSPATVRQGTSYGSLAPSRYSGRGRLLGSNGRRLDSQASISRSLKTRDPTHQW
ncbi:hypothetical protein BJX63DRAFT_68295 [Aspergillus granulosus]|uniref:Uncharacterized protein n=1 Tax=Aspergillus granulosus TaxID=176169 RepID=A0ABR4HSC5_9EURO